jgi:site-specific recombinase XerD
VFRPSPYVIRDAVSSIHIPCIVTFHPMKPIGYLAKVRVAGSNPVVRSKPQVTPQKRGVAGASRKAKFAFRPSPCKAYRKGTAMQNATIHPLVRSHLKAQGRRWTPEHIQNALSVLRRFDAFLQARSVSLVDATADDCRDYLNARHEVVTSTTVHKDYQHLRWFYKFLVAEEDIDTRKVHGPMETVLPPKVADSDPNRVGYVSVDDYARLMSSFSRRSLIDCRDAAICSLMYWSGLRRSEVVRLDRDRLDLDNGVGEVLGKNGKWRTFAILGETVEWLERYLRRRDTDNADRGRGDAVALFASIGGQGAEHLTTGRIRPDAVSAMLDRRCARLGLDVSAHQFRRAMAIEARRRNVSDLAIQETAGWADGRMLKRYTKAEGERLAANEFHANDPTRIGRGGRRLRRVS